MIATGFVYDKRFLDHDAGRIEYRGGEGSADCGEEFDSPQRLLHIKRLFDAVGLTPRLASLPLAPASDKQLLRAHTPAYLESLAAACREAGETIISFGDEARGRGNTEAIARLSAGGACAAIDAVLTGKVPQAYALLRPSGHHAGPDFAMGYCYYNNAGIAARHAQAVYGLKRVAIVDWDVHHGNGTQAVFYEDPSVLFVSLHEEDNYPQGGGDAAETGSGAGEGFNVNVPLPSGSGNATYRAAFERVVLPVLAAFEPELILISAGQDANAFDPLGRMRVTRDGFATMARLVREKAERLCGGRIVVLQEGGYSLPYLPIATLGVLEGLTGWRADFEDPHRVHDWPLKSAEAEAIDRARQAQARYWPTLNVKPKEDQHA
ncbi:class II histone deacetylase [Crenobacter cavernae]|uniref:Class II histone deacetylase n=1 Tax=Crenobacter cavernae TaxID=2290923 RepID=A0ABY0FDW7_9NEIS|nr:class II histone deacetylase [Crenobacter cavernae]RXZ42450.1 class II histone deacetylase [Crenobacter cavernae]